MFTIKKFANNGILVLTRRSSNLKTWRVQCECSILQISLYMLFCACFAVYFMRSSILICWCLWRWDCRLAVDSTSQSLSATWQKQKKLCAMWSCSTVFLLIKWRWPRRADRDITYHHDDHHHHLNLHVKCSF